MAMKKCTVLLIGKTAMGVAKSAALQTAEAAQLNTLLHPKSLESILTVLTLIRMAGGKYDFETLNRYNSKWSEVKIFFILDLFLTKCVRIISCLKF
jgi:hypothetical protein